jgi:hypothetical protein
MRGFLLLLPLCTVAVADNTIPSPLAAAQARGASAHDLARFLADTYHYNVLVAAPDRAVSLSLPDDGAAAVDALAAAAGLVHVTRGKIHLMVPADRVPRAPPPPAHGKLMDVDFAFARLPNLVHLLGDVQSYKIDGAPEGDVSLLGRNVRADAVVEALMAISKRDAKPSPRRFPDGATFPSSGRHVVEVDCPTGDAQPVTMLHVLCTPPETLRLVAVQRERALVVTPGGASRILRKGDLVGRPPVRVIDITINRLRLENRALELGR